MLLFLNFLLYLQHGIESDMKRRVLIGLFLVGMSLLAWPQSSTQGKEFWFSFMQNGYRHYDNNHSDWVETTVMISAKRACTGTIKKAKNAWAGYTFSVEDNGITFVTIPILVAYNEDNEEVVDNKSLVLTATDTVSVFISNVAAYSFDASFVLPVEALGSEYILQTDQQSQSESIQHGPTETSSFLIIATEDNTVVEIMPSVATLKGHGAGVPYTIHMSKGDTYFVRSNYSSEWRDFSGSTVFAHDGKKIAVFNGNTVTCIPGEVGNGRDHIFEQAMPFDSWGRRFIITSSYGRARDIVKVTSSADDNSIYRNGEEIAVIGYGESWEFDIMADEESCYIETSEPSAVYLYNTTWEDPCEPPGARAGDPSMVWIPPVEQRIDEITFCTFNSDNEFAAIEHNYVNVVIHRLDLDRTFLDGQQIDPGEFMPVQGSDDFYFVRKRVSHGTHHLSCDYGLLAHVYGFGDARGYAYCVGINILQANCKMYVNGLWSGSYHDGLYICQGEVVNMKVIASYVVDSVNWDFGDGQTAQGVQFNHTFDVAGDFLAKAYVKGYNPMTLEAVNDTLDMAVHVGETNLYSGTYQECDSIFLFGHSYYHSGYYKVLGTNRFGCDSSYYLTVNIDYTPNFEIEGQHNPIGGSEVYISENEYAIHLTDARAHVDTVLWQVDCPNWQIVPHGKGETCTLRIHSFLLEPVMLHVKAINSCDTICQSFPIQTSYFGEEEMEEKVAFEVLPNPTKGQVTLQFGEIQERVELQVLNSLGQLVDAFAMDAGVCKERTYVMPDVSNGLYFFVMKAEKSTWVRKLCLMR